jgi:hypothetical protein
MEASAEGEGRFAIEARVSEAASFPVQSLLKDA